MSERISIEIYIKKFLYYFGLDRILEEFRVIDAVCGLPAAKVLKVKKKKRVCGNGEHYFPMIRALVAAPFGLWFFQPAENLATSETPTPGCLTDGGF